MTSQAFQEKHEDCMRTRDNLATLTKRPVRRVLPTAIQHCKKVRKVDEKMTVAAMCKNQRVRAASLNLLFGRS